jgi:hypothetical protein
VAESPIAAPVPGRGASAALRLYAAAHAATIELFRRLPIPSRWLGPAKGSISDLEEWIKSRPERGELRWIAPGGSYRFPAPGTSPGATAPFQEARSLEIGPLFMATVARARVVMPTGVIITPDDQVVEQACGWGRRFFPSDLPYNSLRPVLRPHRMRGRYASVVSRSGASYYHWFSECLTRLCLWEEIPSIPFVFPAPLAGWQRESLARIGLAPDQILEVEPGCYEFDELVFPSFPGQVGRVSPPLLVELRRRLATASRRGEERRIHISRAGAPKRHAVNGDELDRRLADAGFETFSGHDLTLEQQIGVMGEAAIVVGCHGGGLTNVLFAAPGTRVIEVIDPEYPISCYYLLSVALGLEYSCVLAVNASRSRGEPVLTGSSDLIVPIDEVLMQVERSMTRPDQAERSPCVL